jgi:hypothetical protein
MAKEAAALPSGQLPQTERRPAECDPADEQEKHPQTMLLTEPFWS